MNSDKPAPDPKDLEWLCGRIQDLHLYLQMTGASVRALSAAVYELAERLGVAELDGVPFAEWVERRRRGLLDEALRSIERVDPLTAAVWLDKLDRLDQEGGDPATG